MRNGKISASTTPTSSSPTNNTTKITTTHNNSNNNTTSAATYDTKSHPRWRSHQIAEDYISLATSITLPPTHLGPFGYSPTTGHYPIEQVTALGYLTSPLRRPTVIEKWSPYEISTFEAALSLYGKVFHHVQKWVKTKNTKEIIEFYYIWKKTSHGRRWKGSFVEEIMESDDDDDEDEDDHDGGNGEGGGGDGNKNGSSENGMRSGGVGIGIGKEKMSE
ncbi:hypothetical protein ACHAXR_005585 [Thalassiosira sp. AJA248-18]